jgi:hypothetical protein
MDEEVFPWRNEGNSDSDYANHGRDYETSLLYRIRRSTAWMAFFTLVMAIGAGVAAYFYWQQLNQIQTLSDEIQRQAAASRKALESLSEVIDQNTQRDSAASQKLSELMDQSIQRESVSSQKLSASIDRSIDLVTKLVGQSIDVTNKQTAAIQTLAEIASDSRRVSNRPWMGIESVVPTAALAVNRPFGLKVVIRNGGRSPAAAVRTVLNAAIRTTGDVTPPNVDGCTDCGHSGVLPNGTLGYDVTLNRDLLTKDVVDGLKDGTNAILLYGRIDYTDSAANKHVTTVCMKYQFTSTSFGSCPQGNDFN